MQCGRSEQENASLVDPIEEVNWDRETNPFEYIIQQQFYELSPNPNAATTLYTDYNITSSKIITADNITTMRSDLNIVTNNVDVIDFDVKELTSKVETKIRYGSATIKNTISRERCK